MNINIAVRNASGPFLLGGPKMHVVVDDAALCKATEGLEPIEVMTGEGFDEWVRSDRGAHGFRRGLCVGCRRNVPKLLKRIRKDGD